MSDADVVRDAETQLRPGPNGVGDSNAAGSKTNDKAKPTASNESENTRNGEDASNADARDDSEAETVVLPGKGDIPSSQQRKVIKQEGNDSSNLDGVESEADHRNGNNLTADHSDTQDKKLSKDLTGTSSNLSSVKSSPAPETVPSPAASDNEFAKPDNKDDSETPFMGLLQRKRKNTSDIYEDKGHKRRQRRDISIESTANTTASDRDRRERRGESNARSESPPTRTRTRALSTKSNQPPNTKRRKPPPLQVGSRTRQSVDADDGSEDSDRRPGPHKLRKLPPSDTIAMSPAKPPHKKLKDKSGRTFLARACDTEDVEAVKARLAERPEDLDVEDYAGNTPLQIAALAGSDDIVKVLLEAGCDINCKNVDKDTPLIDAVENGHLEVIKLLVDAGMDPGQSNARGEELLDLLDSDGDNYEEIKSVLVKAKEQRRKSSEDQPRASASIRSPRESAHPSPPPSLSTGSRRRANRRDPTRNDLLYVNATPEMLREKAKIGDDEAVDHILNMRPIADIPAVLAAARGGHEMSLQLLIAIGKPEPDPNPLHGEKLSQSTPMLAAIGRGNRRVIELLLEQPGFNPTRRIYKQLAYHELAKDRRGMGWEEEYRLLKKAYEGHKGRSSNGASPNNRKDSQSHQELKKSKSDIPVTTTVSAKRSSPEIMKDGLTRKRSGLEVKRTIERRERDRPSDKGSDSSRKHLRVPTKAVSREPSSAISDREVSPLGIPKEKDKKHKRSMSEAETQEEMPKPTRKRLISGRALRDDEEKRRRASWVSVASSSSQEPSKQKDSPGSQTKKIKREDSRDSRPSNIEQIKKRPRPSPSPSESNSPTLRRSPDLKKTTKRIRVDADGKPVKRNDSEGAKHESTQPSSKTTAPVASMGNTMSQGKEPKSRLNDNTKGSPKSDSRKTSPRRSSESKDPLKPDIRKTSPRSSPKSQSTSKEEVKRERDTDKEQSEMSKQLNDEVQAAAEQDERRQREKEQKEQELKLQKEKELLEQQEKERQAREEAAEAERKAKEAEAARLEAQRLAEEAERKARIEREEEEARQEKKRQEEEQARLAAERERKRKEEEERQLRLRAEREEKERLEKIKKQEEEERRRREALPNALKILAELTPEQARQESEVSRWLPLYTAKGCQLAPTDGTANSDEIWVSNIQAASILGIHDLDLSQYTAWTKRPATKAERASLWRVLRRRLTRYEPPPYGPVDHTLEFQMDKETREKYDALNRVFWIRLSDLEDIVPRYPHLAFVDLKRTAIGLPHLQETTQRPLPNGNHQLSEDSYQPEATLANGYH